MFSEYMDNIEKPVDNMVNKDEDNKERNFSGKENNSNEELNGKDKLEQMKSSKIKNQINGWVTFLRNSDPNNANPKEQQYTLSSAFSESMESGIGQIAEKKIPGFEKVLPDGSKAKVVCSDNSFVLSITKESTTGRKEYLNINLSNFQNNGNNMKNNENNKKENTMPNMTITGNIKLLDNNLVGGMSEKSVGDNINLSIGDQYDIVKIVNSIEENVMRLEREDVHGNYHVQMEKKEQESKKIDDFRVFLCELQFNPQKNNEEMLIYLTNPNIDFDKNNQDYKGIIIALCRLCSRHNSVIEVIKKLNLGEDKDQDSKQENLKTFTGEESVIEYLSGASDSELSTIIKNKDKIIELSKEI